MIREKSGQLRRFWAAYGPIVFIIWFRYRSDLFRTVVLSVGGAVAQAGLIAVLVGGIRVLNPEDTIKLFGFEETLRAHRVATLSGIVVLYIAVGFYSSWSGWRREVISRKMARKFLEQETESLLGRVANAKLAPRNLPTKLINPADAFIQNPLVTSIALETVIDLIPPIIQTVIFTAALIVLDWRLSFVAIPILALPLPALFVLNRVTHRASSRFYGQERRDATRRIVELVKDADKEVQPGNALMQAYREDPLISDANDDYDKYKLANQEANFLTSNYRSAGIGLGLFGFGLAAVFEWLSWVTILGSILALQRLQAAASLALSHVTSLIRFVSIVEERNQFSGEFPDGDTAPEGESESRVPEQPCQTHLVVADSQFGKIVTSAVFREMEAAGYRFREPSLMKIPENPPGMTEDLRSMLERLRVRGAADSGPGESGPQQGGVGVFLKGDWESLLPPWKRLVAELAKEISGGSRRTLVAEGVPALVNIVLGAKEEGFFPNTDFVFITRRWKGIPPDVDEVWKFEKGQIVGRGTPSWWAEHGGLDSMADSDGDDTDLTSL